MLLVLSPPNRTNENLNRMCSIQKKNGPESLYYIIRRRPYTRILFLLWFVQRRPQYSWLTKKQKQNVLWHRARTNQEKKKQHHHHRQRVQQRQQTQKRVKKKTPKPNKLPTLAQRSSLSRRYTRIYELWEFDNVFVVVVVFSYFFLCSRYMWRVFVLCIVVWCTQS